MIQEPNNINEEILLNKMFSLMAVGINASLERFSSWMLAGFGAAFGLILSNIESVSNFIEVESIKTAIILYLCALSAGVIQRWLSSSINAGTMFSDESEQLGANAPDDVDFEKIISEVESNVIYPQRWLVSWQFSKVKAGELSAAGKLLYKMAQVQGLLIIAQGVLVISSIVVVLNGFSA